MKFSIFPKEEKFFEMFDQQASLIKTICGQFKDLVDNFTEVAEKVEAINKTENEGDDLLYQISVKLAGTFVTPIDREDIHGLGNHMDDIIDLIQGAATRMLMFNVKGPKPGLIELTNIIDECSGILVQGMKRLPKFDDISDLRKSIRKLETKADKVNRQAIADLFGDCETVADVLQLMKWKEIIEKAENAVDKFEDVFDVLEGVVIKHA